MSGKLHKTIGSNRQSVQRQQYRVLDESARNRRQRNRLEQLERDNFHDDPHANLVMHKKAPKFEDNSKTNGNSGSSSNKRHALPRSRLLTIHNLIEEDAKTGAPNYTTCTAPAPTPTPTPCNNSDKRLAYVVKRHFCSVCGFASNYTCVNCGMRYCCLNCLKTHRDTRCLKWTA